MPLTEKDLDHILLYTKPLWRNLTGKKIFVTGGTGFFGKWLLESFEWANSRLNLNAELMVLSRDPDSFKTKNPHFTHSQCIRFCRGDVRNFKFPREHFDFIIHVS